MGAGVVERVAEHDEAANQEEGKGHGAPQPPVAAQLRDEEVRPRLLRSAAGAPVQQEWVLHVIGGAATVIEGFCKLTLSNAEE